MSNLLKKMLFWSPAVFAAMLITVGDAIAVEIVHPDPNHPTPIPVEHPDDLPLSNGQNHPPPDAVLQISTSELQDDARDPEQEPFAFASSPKLTADRSENAMLTPETNGDSPNFSQRDPSVQNSQSRDQNTQLSSMLDRIDRYAQTGEGTLLQPEDGIDRYAQTGEGTLLQPEDWMNQVTSVSQLSDVQPTDWAFQALQSLVERYGCIAGYPDGTYKGNRALSRYEFAAGLNACLDRISELIAAATADLATKEDLAVLQKLQDEFAAELATLRGRVDALEARAAELEANQFSTTTKLRGEVAFAISSAFGGEKADGSGEDIEDNPVLNDRIRLHFDTSFTGRDLLKVRLDALSTVPFGPGEGDDPNITGTHMTRLNFDEGSNNDLRLGKLFYAFSVGSKEERHAGEEDRDDDDDDHDEHGHGHHGHGPAPGAKLSFVIDATGGEFNENFVNFNEFFSEELTGAISRFGRFNPIYFQGLEGAGASLTYAFSDVAHLSLGYLAAEAGNPEPKNGLFNGAYGALGQLSFFPTDTIRFGLTYARAFFPGEEVVVSGETGSELANEPFGGLPTSADNFGVQASFRISPRFTLSGWFGATIAHAEDDGVGVDEGDSATILNWALTFAFPDVGAEGSLLGLIVGQPPRVVQNSGGAEADGSSWHLEALYRYQINDNISINPGVLVILNPENNNSNDAIWVATLKTIFEF